MQGPTTEFRSISCASHHLEAPSIQCEVRGKPLACLYTYEIPVDFSHRDTSLYVTRVTQP